MKKVQIEPGCITCGLCEFLAPDVFQVTDVARVKPGKETCVDARVEQAAQMCPVQVIKISKDFEDAARLCPSGDSLEV